MVESVTVSSLVGQLFCGFFFPLTCFFCVAMVTGGGLNAIFFSSRLRCYGLF